MQVRLRMLHDDVVAPRARPLFDNPNRPLEEVLAAAVRRLRTVRFSDLAGQVDREHTDALQHRLRVLLKPRMESENGVVLHMARVFFSACRQQVVLHLWEPVADVNHWTVLAEDMQSWCLPWDPRPLLPRPESADHRSWQFMKWKGASCSPNDSGNDEDKLLFVRVEPPSSEPDARGIPFQLSPTGRAGVGRPENMHEPVFTPGGLQPFDDVFQLLGDCPGALVDFPGAAHELHLASGTRCSLHAISVADALDVERRSFQSRKRGLLSDPVELRKAGLWLVGRAPCYRAAVGLTIRDFLTTAGFGRSDRETDKKCGEHATSLATHVVDFYVRRFVDAGLESIEDLADPMVRQWLTLCDAEHLRILGLTLEVATEVVDDWRYLRPVPPGVLPAVASTRTPEKRFFFFCKSDCCDFFVSHAIAVGPH